MIRTLSYPILLGLVAGAAACSSPSGPVAPTYVGSPREKVTITPDLQEFISVPDVPGNQILDYTADGLLRFQFQLQNKSDKSFFLAVTPTFYDRKRVVVDQQAPRRVPFTPYQIQTISVVCTNKEGADLQVQVSPAR